MYYIIYYLVAGSFKQPDIIYKLYSIKIYLTLLKKFDFIRMNSVNSVNMCAELLNSSSSEGIAGGFYGVKLRNLSQFLKNWLPDLI